MSEWWSYGLSDFLLFSARTYYRQFELYNAAIWPWQALAIAAGLAVFALLLRPSDSAGRTISIILAACWLWVAWGYFLTRHLAINWAAIYFAAGFALQALLLVLVGAPRSGRRAMTWRRWVGVGVFTFALLVQPLLGPLSGRPLSQAEIFGIAPDPTAVGTIGILLALGRPRYGLMAIPTLWCLMSAAMLWTMGAPEAWLMLAGAVLPLGAALRDRLSRTRKREPPSQA